MKQNMTSSSDKNPFDLAYVGQINTIKALIERNDKLKTATDSVCNIYIF